MSTPVSATSATPPRPSIAKWFGAGNTMLWVLLGLIVVGSIATNGVFLRPTNVATVLYQSSVVGLLAIAQAIAIIGKGLDLSVGSIAILIAVMVGDATSASPSFMPSLPLPAAIGVAALVAVLVGSVNGFLAAKTGVPAFITTLAMYLVLQGCIFMLTNASPVNDPDPLFRAFGDAKVFGLPAPIFGWAAGVGVAYVFLNWLKQGQQLYAVGANETTARLSGVPVLRFRMVAYAVGALFAGFAGLLFLARTGTVLPSDGGSFMMDSIAAVAVGGISLNGGSGRVRDVVIGVLTLAVGVNLMNLAGVSQYVQSAVQGFIILIAVGVNLWAARRKGGT